MKHRHKVYQKRGHLVETKALWIKYGLWHILITASQHWFINCHKHTILMEDVKSLPTYHLVQKVPIFYLLNVSVNIKLFYNIQSMETSIRACFLWLGTNVTSSEVSEDAVAQVWMEHQAIVCGALSGSPPRGGAGEEQWTAPASEGDLSEEGPLLPNLSYCSHYPF